MLRYRHLRLGLVVAALAALVAVSGCQLSPSNDAVVRSRSSTSASSDSYNPTSDDRLRGSQSDDSQPESDRPDDGSDDGSDEPEPEAPDDGSSDGLEAD